VRHEIVELTASHLNHIVTVAREADRVEFSYQDPRPMREVLEEMLRKSHRARCGLIDGEPVCCFGVIRPVVLTTEGHPWAVASRLVEEKGYRRVFLQQSRRGLAEVVKGYTSICNIIHEENSLAIRWLKWLGFTVSDARFDVGGGWFRHFEMKV